MGTRSVESNAALVDGQATRAHMIKVECVSCKAPYELDPKRIPDKGMKMRCPKCGASFMVSKDGAASPAAAVAAPPAPPKITAPLTRTQMGAGAAPVPPPIAAPLAPPFSPKGTMLGHNAPTHEAPKGQAQKPRALGLAPDLSASPPERSPAGSLIPPPGERPSGPAKMPSQKIAPPVATAGNKNAAAKGAFGATIHGASPALKAPAPAANAAPELSDELMFGASVDMPEDLPPPPKPAADPDAAQDLSVSRMYVDMLPPPRGEVDLPAPRFEADLPAPKVAARPAAQHADLPRAKVPAPAPAPKPQAQGFGEASDLGFGDLDLPAAKGSADLPARKAQAAPAAAPARKPPSDFGNLDLLGDGDGADLPTVKSGADLPAVKSLADLPAPKGGADLPALLGAADLPTPKGLADLPTPRGRADLPAAKTLADLPVPQGHKDLPSPKHGGAGFGDLDIGGTDGVAAFGDLDLPAPKSAQVQRAGFRSDESSFADLDLELPDLPLAATDPPASRRRGDDFGDIELPPPKPAADLVPPKARTVQGMGAAGRKAVTRDESSFSDLSLDDERDSDLPPSLLGEDESSFSDLGEPPPFRRTASAVRPPSAARRPATAPLADEDVEELEPDGEYGDAGAPDLDSGEELGDEEGFEEGDDEASEEEMEFGISGDEARGGVSLPPEILRRQRGEEFEAKQAALGRRTVTIVVRVAILLVLLVGTGFALKFTEHGVFGIYYLERYLPEAGDLQLARGAIDKAEKIAVSDTYADAKRSLKELGDARGQAGLNRELLSRGVVHQSLFILRFGQDANSAAHAAAIIKRLEERSWLAPHVELARGADAARRGKWSEATAFLSEARGKAARDPYVELIVGEVALAQGKLDEADKAFAKALALGGGARAQWGIARIVLLRGDREAQTAAVNETLKLSPMHVDARIAEARILWDQGREDRALHQLRVALGLEPTEDDQHLWSSKQSVASGYSLLGYVHESKGRGHPAKLAYEDALSADPYRVEALLGSGRVLLREKRHSDALARFESALSSATKGNQNPTVLGGRKADAEAQLGIGRALLALDRGQEAKAKLEELGGKLPNDPEVVLALGENEQGLGNPQTAETLFRKSIELAPKRFDGYLALAQLFFKQGDAGKASEILNDAASHVEETAEMRQMLGQSELKRNRLESAIHEFKRALELNPHAIDAMFGMASALRKHGDLDQSAKVLEEIGKRDPGFGGLAEEKGLLYESKGEFAKAVQSYRDALEKEAGNHSLLLRLGGAQVAAGALDDAEQTLAKVIRERPNSAEAEYFIGRIAFARGRSPDALTHFDRAVSLDGTKGEYHLYVARASFEMGNMGRAFEEALATMSFDPNLGDAYWVRAMVRIRQSAVKDALRDLNKALKLNPARDEAYASMAEAYEQLRDMPAAIKAYRTALAKQPANGEWWYKLTIVYADSGSRAEAESAVKRAIEIGDKADPMPYWLPDAYRLGGELAEIRSDRTAAIRFYKRYDEIAAPSAIDRYEIEKKLKGWGVQTEDDE